MLQMNLSNLMALHTMITIKMLNMLHQLEKESTAGLPMNLEDLP